MTNSPCRTMGRWLPLEKPLGQMSPPWGRADVPILEKHPSNLRLETMDKSVCRGLSRLYNFLIGQDLQTLFY